MPHRWLFRTVDGHTEVTPPSGINPEATKPLTDFIFAEVSTRESLAVYLRFWAKVSTDPEAAREGVAGNGTCQSIDGEDVILESLYDQYEPVHIPRQAFEQFLEQYSEFLR